LVKLKNKAAKILLSVFVLSFICTTLISNNVYAESEFSENLEHEKYDPEIDIDSGWFDAIETFWFDEVNEAPHQWIIETTGLSTIDIKDLHNHKRILYLDDDDGTYEAKATYFFPDMTFESSDSIKITFWIRFSENTDTKRLYIYLNDVSGNYFLIDWYKDGTTRVSGSYSTFGILPNPYRINEWLYVELYIKYDSYYSALFFDYVGVYDVNNVLVNSYSTDLQLTDDSIAKLNNFTIQTDSARAPTDIYFDALNYEFIPNMAHYNDYKFYTQIQNIDSNYRVNKYMLDDSKSFSLYDSVISEKADLDNNFRNYFITDNFINTELIDTARVIRMKGTDVTQNKYKVIQMYFNDLNNSNAFREGYNQLIRIRVDSFDSADLLINKYYLNLDFNNETGLLTWDADYRESATIPRWNKEPTNPIFNFSDYLPENTTIDTMEISLHFFLTYNATHRLFCIRTTIAFNQNYQNVYSYDKIINAGDGAFYNTQSKIKVKYLDYFNPNNGSDYIGNTWYVYNNLRGLRTLKTNSTDYWFNFLECGFFSDIIYYYEPPEPEPTPEPPSEVGRPAGADYYYEYTAWKINAITLEITVGNWTYNWTGFELESFTAKSWFDYDAIGYVNNKVLARSWGDWSWAWNWLRDGLATIVAFVINLGIGLANMFWLLVQYLKFIGEVAFTWIVVYLIIGLIFCGVFWNIGARWIVQGIAYLAWWAFYLGVWIWQAILYPALDWLFNDALKFILTNIIIPLATFFITLAIWSLTLGQGSWTDIWNNVSTMLDYLVAEFLDTIDIFLIYLPYFLQMITVYITFTGVIYAEFLYFRARGWHENAEEMYLTYTVYFTPFRIIMNLVNRIRGTNTKEA